MISSSSEWAQKELIDFASLGEIPLVFFEFLIFFTYRRGNFDEDRDVAEGNAMVPTASSAAIVLSSGPDPTVLPDEFLHMSPQPVAPTRTRGPVHSFKHQPAQVSAVSARYHSRHWYVTTVTSHFSVNSAIIMITWDCLTNR
jgi:hypothetical protein